jgi:uncharacterized membrane protein YdfJ with MMPL/SSD domain
VPSASRRIFRFGLLVICAALVAAAISGCTTTQETAELKQAESKRILERRDHRQAKKQRSKPHDHGSDEQ